MFDEARENDEQEHHMISSEETERLKSHHWKR